MMLTKPNSVRISFRSQKVINFTHADLDSSALTVNTP